LHGAGQPQTTPIPGSNTSGVGHGDDLAYAYGLVLADFRADACRSQPRIPASANCLMTSIAGRPRISDRPADLNVLVRAAAPPPDQPFGRSTLSITWMTPLFAWTSAF